MIRLKLTIEASLSLLLCCCVVVVQNDPVCIIPAGMFDGMVISTNVAEPYYGAICNTNKSDYVQRVVQKCTPYYCCSQPCDCVNPLDSNTCPDQSSAITISCYKLQKEYADNLRNCCAGYAEDEVHNCRAIYSCSVNNGGCDQLCLHNETTNKDYCACYLGYQRFYNGSVARCIDIDECATSNGGCNGTCHNTNGSFSCTCPDGFALDNNNRSCIDINECLTDNGGCTSAGKCINTYGNYYCECDTGTLPSNNNHTCIGPEASHSNQSPFPYQYIIAIVVGLFCLLILLILLILLFLWCRRRRRRQKQAMAFENVVYGENGEKINEPNVYIIPGKNIGGSVRSTKDFDDLKGSKCDSDYYSKDSTKSRSSKASSSKDSKCAGSSKGTSSSKGSKGTQSSKGSSTKGSTSKGSANVGTESFNCHDTVTREIYCKDDDDDDIARTKKSLKDQDLDDCRNGGKKGKYGRDGKNGKDGMDGMDQDFDDCRKGGKRGKDGRYGNDGKDGMDGMDEELEGAVGFSRPSPVVYSFEDLDRPKNNATDCKVIYDFEATQDDLRPNEYATALTSVNIPTTSNNRAINEYAQSVNSVKKPTLYMRDPDDEPLPSHKEFSETDELENPEETEPEKPVYAQPETSAAKPSIAPKPTEYANASEMAAVGGAREKKSVMTGSRRGNNYKDDGGYAEIGDVPGML